MSAIFTKKRKKIQKRRHPGEKKSKKGKKNATQVADGCHRPTLLRPIHRAKSHECATPGKSNDSAQMANTRKRRDGSRPRTLKQTKKPPLSAEVMPHMATDRIISQPRVPSTVYRAAPRANPAAAYSRHRSLPPQDSHVSQ